MDLNIKEIKASQSAIKKNVIALELGSRNWKQVPYNRLILITKNSPKSLRNALEKIAWYFKREKGYDFCQYHPDEKDEYRGYLLIDPFRDLKVIGGCCFAYREPSEINKEGHHMSWVWIHPYFRGKGILSEVWDYFKFEFGEFICEPPLSNAMQAFLKKVN